MAEEDLIFGRNRHFYGGMEPSNMANFTVGIENGAVKIYAQLPADTIIDGQTLCPVAGAVIRRKVSGYPKDEFDGDLVSDISTSLFFIDDTADPTGTYYYRAFPYSTRGVYNRNVANKAAINEPDPMVRFESESLYDVSTDIATVQLTVDIPDTAAGAIIRRSAVCYPMYETDGEEYMNISESGVYIDNSVAIGNIYYYSAFPYTDNGSFNYSENNRTSVMVNRYTYFFGYDLDISDSDPDTRVSYPSDVENVDFIPAYMDFSTGIFNYGSWPSTPGDKFMPSPCMLNYDGTVAYYLDPNDYTKKEDGSASDVADTSFGGNAMMEWGKIYTKRWEDENGIYHFRCCNYQIEEDYECWCNYDKNNNQIDHFYTPIYFGSLVSSTLRSISGQSNFVNTTATSEITYARANGNDWYTEVLVDRLLIQDLLVMMAKSTDGQTAYGSGRCYSSNTYAINPGTMNTNGMFWGSTDQTSGVKVFGMENWWGNLWRRTAGWICDMGTQKVKLTRGIHDGSTATDYNTDGTGYLTVDGATPIGTSNSYIKTMKTMPYGRIPYDISGSSSTYEADAMYFNNTDVLYACVGGPWAHDLRCGPFYAFLYYNASGATTNHGAAISCKPTAN